MCSTSHIGAIDLNDLISWLQTAIACHQALWEHLQKKLEHKKLNKLKSGTTMETWNRDRKLGPH